MLYTLYISVFWKVSSYSSVSASDHHGGLTWSCFLVTECCAHSHAWLSLKVDKYSDSSYKCNSSHKQKESLSCVKLGAQWEIAISIFGAQWEIAIYNGNTHCRCCSWQPHWL